MSKFVAGIDQSIRIDNSNSTSVYIGKAIIGSATSGAVWQIKKIANASSVYSFTWADSNNAYDNIWDNRASLTYG